MSGFMTTFKVDYGGIREVKRSDKNGEEIVTEGGSSGEKTATVSEDLMGDNSSLPKYMIFMMGGIVLLLILIFIVWYCARKRMMIKVKERVHNLRLQARPENLLRNDIKGNIK